MESKVDTYLKHSGILGMHWGHRKASVHPSHKPRATKSVVRKPKTTITKPILTDDQLRNRINRLQMEKTYAQLTQKETSPGKKWIKDVVLNAGKTVATAYVEKMLKQSLGLDVPKTPAAKASK